MPNIRTLERMRPVRADRELELEQQFVCRWSIAVRRPPILAAHLAELARPVGQQDRLSGIEDRRVLGPVRAIEADPGEPPASELVITGDVEAAGRLPATGLIAPAPDDLAAADERPVN